MQHRRYSGITLMTLSLRAGSTLFSPTETGKASSLLLPQTARFSSQGRRTPMPMVRLMLNQQCAGRPAPDLNSAGRPQAPLSPCAWTRQQRQWRWHSCSLPSASTFCTCPSSPHSRCPFSRRPYCSSLPASTSNAARSPHLQLHRQLSTRPALCHVPRHPRLTARCLRRSGAHGSRRSA